MRTRRIRYNIVALAMLLIMSIVGCDVMQNDAANGPQSVTPTQGTGSATGAQQPSQQGQQQASQRPTSSAPLSDQEIGRGGVAQAQEQPTPLPGEAGALSEYESIINNVYLRDSVAVVNLTDGQVTGSGFVIDREGHIVTNNHVAGEMQEIQITFGDRSFANGQLVGTFPEGDIAVVKADRLPEGLEPVELGDSAQLQVGQISIAIGSPLGLQQTVTSGIISALNRSINDIDPSEDPGSSLQGLIQTDAAINPGNSGGPLFDSRGRVIGMNTLIATRNEGNIGLGFAVPVNRIKRVARQLIETGQYRRPLIGATVQQLIPQIARRLNLPTTSGVILAEVSQGGPAANAGLQGATEAIQVQGSDGSTINYPANGDIITAVNGQAVRTLGDLRNILETEADPGDTVTITFLREGREQQTQLTLAAQQ